MPLLELDSLVGVVRQEGEGKPDPAGGISPEIFLIREIMQGYGAATMLSAVSHLVFSMLMSETVGLPCKKIK